MENQNLDPKMQQPKPSVPLAPPIPSSAFKPASVAAPASKSPTPPPTPPPAPLKPMPSTPPTPPPPTPPAPPTPTPPAPPTSSTPPPPPARSFFSRFLHSKLILIIPGVLILVVIALIASAYVVYGMGKTSMGEDFQNKVWVQMVDSSLKETQDSKLSITYTDSGSYQFKPSNFAKAFGIFTDEELNQYDSQYSFKISDLTIAGNVNAYLNVKDEDAPQTDTHVDLSLTNDAKEYSGNVDIKLNDSEAFGKFDYNDNIQKTVDAILGSHEVAPGKGKWIKSTDKKDIDTIRSDIKSAFYDSRDVGTVKLLKENRLFDIKQLDGLTYIDGHVVAHYSLALNKDRFHKYVEDSIDEGSLADSKFKQQSKDIANAIVDKIEFKNYEIWVGVTNHKMYKSQLTLNAISVSKTLQAFQDAINKPGILNPKDQIKNTDAKARDARRVSDARSISSAVELYYEANGHYPEAKDGQPVGVIEAGFIQKYPASPTPPDGTCTDYYNTYWYTQVSPQSYKIEFCLGQATAGMKSGEVALTEKGIPAEFANQPGTSESTIKQEDSKIEDDFYKIAMEVIKQLNFDAELKIETESKNIGTVKTIEMPTDFIKKSDLDK